MSNLWSVKDIEEFLDYYESGEYDKDNSIKDESEWLSYLSDLPFRSEVWR